ncbi:MAG: hypothetical protein M3Z08_21685 [Chloroflexota bacterium]|nr:hypothetical protein [Chloroflexota bacterium]
MTQNVIDPPGKPLPHISQPLRDQHTRLSTVGAISLLVLICLLLTLFTGLLVYSLSPIGQRAATIAATATHTPPTPTDQLSPTSSAPTSTPNLSLTPTPVPPVYSPNNVAAAPLQLPGGHYVIYEQQDRHKPQQNNLYMISLDGSGSPRMLTTPGYMYNEAVRPVLTPSGQLLYSGNGLWLTDIFSGTATQITTLAPNFVITSMDLSTDGKWIAWTTEPADGQGMIDTYAGPLGNPVRVYEQSAENCPCFRVFSMLDTLDKHDDGTLLLTDDRGSHEAVQNGLWVLDLGTPPSTTPVQILDEDPQQGPLLLSPYGNMLLYSTNEGEVPFPTDNSVPQDIAALTYANSLSLGTLGGHPLAVNGSQVILPEQHNLHSIADYHWVTTPLFSPDERSLVYVEFSSDEQAPYNRHSALYMVQISGSGSHLHVGTPKLLATSTAQLFELGGWFNNHVLTLYGDRTLYALDIQTGAVATIVQANSYARVVAIAGAGLI